MVALSLSPPPLTAASGILHGVASRSEPSKRTVERWERRLAQQLADGDKRGLEELHARVGSMVLGFLVKATGDRGLAEDVFQQVFLEAWRRGPEYDVRRASPATWVMTIARSRAIDALRRRVPEPRDPQAPTAVADPSTDDLDELWSSWRLQSLLASLPEGERAVLRLRFGANLSGQEAAAALGVAEGTVKSRTSRALDRLRARLEAEGET